MDTPQDGLLRGYPDWLFFFFVLWYAALSAGAIAVCWPL